ncbi:MAG: type VI secretion system tip protein VgrG [Polyangiaceae bacterium]|nr:type VI secretion system tip protein VgrG [Polyangiaceae bacterium]
MNAPVLDALRPLSTLTLEVASKDSLDVREFSVREGMNMLFGVELTAVSPSADVDFSKILGQRATFQIQRAHAAGALAQRSWTGVCSHIEQLRVEEDGLSTYALTIVPDLWLLTQRRNYRIFQQVSEPRIVLELLAEWSIEADVRLRLEDYKERKYRVQYAESDYAFLCRVLEDAGISFYFDDGQESKLVLTDAPEKDEARVPQIPFVATPNERVAHEFVTGLRVMQQVRPGKYTVRDHDYRRAPDFPLVATAKGGDGVEERLERFHYVPGSFLFRTEQGTDTPVADDRGKTRADLEEGRKIAENRLAAKRGNARTVVFHTSATDLRPGMVVSITHHPRQELAPDKTLLLVSTTLAGTATGTWSHLCESRFTDAPFKPALSTPKPKTQGIESATIVGPDGEEIHTDEFGRVRVHFHWDRESERNERSSCWIHVSQPWGGGGFGAINLPRIGQEVLVDFLGGDPDRPVIVGRVFTNLQKTPYDLPRFKMVSGIRSESTQGFVAGGSPPGAAPAPAPAQARARRAPPPGGGGQPPSPPPPRNPAEPRPPPRSPLGNGSPMSAQELDSTLRSRNFQARSPNTIVHRHRGSELSFDDTRGREITYLQAQRDLNVVVKNAWTSVVGAHRSTRIGTDDILEVEYDQSIRVNRFDRDVKVGRDQKHTVMRHIEQEAVEGDQTFMTKKGKFWSHAKRQVLSSDESIILRVGQSSIVMGPDFVVIESPNTFINPGPYAAEAAMEGTRPLTTQELEAMARQRAAEQQASERARADARRAREEEFRTQGRRDMREQGNQRGPNSPLAQADRNFQAATTPSDRAYWDLKRFSYQGQMMNGGYDTYHAHIMRQHGLSESQADAVMRRYASGG